MPDEIRFREVMGRLSEVIDGRGSAEGVRSGVNPKAKHPPSRSEATSGGID